MINSSKIYQLCLIGFFYIVNAESVLANIVCTVENKTPFNLLFQVIRAVETKTATRQEMYQAKAFRKGEIPKNSTGVFSWKGTGVYKLRVFITAPGPLNNEIAVLPNNMISIGWHPGLNNRNISITIGYDQQKKQFAVVGKRGSIVDTIVSILPSQVDLLTQDEQGLEELWIASQNASEGKLFD